MAVHRSHQKIARSAAAVACEHAPRAICAVCRRRKAEYQHARSRIAKSRNGLSPVRVIAKGRTFHTSNFATVRAQAFTLRARDDVVMNFNEGHSVRRDFSSAKAE